jgi:hypothetical protein
MRLHPDRLFNAHPAGRKTVFFLGLLLFVLSISCSITIPGGGSNIETQTALSIQQTISARQAEQAIIEPTENQDGTVQAQAALDKLSQDATQTAQQAGEVSEGSQATLDSKTTQDAEQTGATASQVPTEQAAPTATIDMGTKLASANILLFEDMVNDPIVMRYYRDTLERMGLNYTDVGSAKGKLKAELYSGAPDGKPWDLIILASEYKGSISGEFFNYVNDALDKGSSVILETWYLDKVHTGTARTILVRCGVEYETSAPGQLTVEITQEFVQCPSCDENIPEGAEICPFCETTFASDDGTAPCPGCGTTLTIGVSSCDKCGMEFE